MTALAGPLLIACATLAIGGFAKVANPLPTRRALYAMGMPSSGLVVRAIGVAEVAVAIGGVVAGGAITRGLVGVVYLGFAAFIVAALSNPKVSSCGCFGSSSASPTAAHIVFNLALAGIAFGSIGSESLIDIARDQPGAGVPLVFVAAIGTFATVTAFTSLPAATTRAQNA